MLPPEDGVTWKEYENGLEERIAELKDRVHRGALALHEDGMGSLSSDKVCRASSLVVSAAITESVYTETRRKATT
jgi:hypothetical protein